MRITDVAFSIPSLPLLIILSSYAKSAIPVPSPPIAGSPSAVQLTVPASEPRACVKFEAAKRHRVIVLGEFERAAKGAHLRCGVAV